MFEAKRENTDSHIGLYFLAPPLKEAFFNGMPGAEGINTHLVNFQASLLLCGARRTRSRSELWGTIIYYIGRLFSPIVR